VFERFYQAPNQPDGVTAGSGIGLALTKELVEMHDGTLRVESPPGQGATFTFALPVTRQAPPADAPLAEPNPVPARLPEAALLADAENPERPDAAPEAPLVLVIEDNPDVRRFIRESLEGDYQVAEACNGAEGVEKATELVPDLVISDVMMPGMDGYQACRALKAREETSHIPVILLTAKAGLESKLEGLDTGADDYLAKPFHTAELKGRIRNLIQLRKRLQLKYMAQTITEQPQAPLPAPENAFLARLRAVVEANFRDEEFSIEQLSREIGMSRTQVHRKLKALTNQSASQFIRTLRLQKARALLLTGRHNVSEAAYLTGFNSPAYFSTCFTELYGYPPSELKVKDGQA
jgi:CheY-like chemotaxis protein